MINAAMDERHLAVVYPCTADTLPIKLVQFSCSKANMVVDSKKIHISECQ